MTGIKKDIESNRRQSSLNVLTILQPREKTQNSNKVLEVSGRPALIQSKHTQAMRRKSTADVGGIKSALFGGGLNSKRAKH